MRRDLAFALLATIVTVPAAGCGGGKGSATTRIGSGAPPRVDVRGDRHFRMGDNPTGVVAAAGMIVAAGIDGTVTRVSPATDRLVGRTLTLGDETSDVASGEDAAWVLAKRDNPDTPKVDWEVDRIDPGTGRARTVARVKGYSPHELAVDHGVIWVTEESRHAVERFDARSGRPVGAPIRTGPSPWGLGVGGGSAWVGDAHAHTLTRVDARSGRIVGRPIRLREEVFEVAVDKGSTWVTQDRSLFRVRSSGRVTRTRILGIDNTSALGVPAGALLIGSDTHPGRVYRVNPRTGRPLGTHPRPLVFANAIHAVTYLDGSIWAATNNPVAFDHDEIVRTSR
jgi:streptogramin lyase